MTNIIQEKQLSVLLITQITVGKAFLRGTEKTGNKLSVSTGIHFVIF